MVNRVQEIIGAKYQPDGFNIGFNVNQAGGQKVKHTHIHLIPRYRGDNQGKKTRYSLCDCPLKTIN